MKNSITAFTRQVSLLLHENVNLSIMNIQPQNSKEKDIIIMINNYITQYTENKFECIAHGCDKVGAEVGF